MMSSISEQNEVMEIMHLYSDWSDFIINFNPELIQNRYQYVIQPISLQVEKENLAIKELAKN
jgi:hypothetical protein